MPVVPFTATQSKFAAAQARGKVPQGPPPAEPFALMAAAQMHAEGRLIQVGDKQEPLPLASTMSDEDYDNTWVRSEARRGRTDDQMRAVEPNLEPYRLAPDSDMISYHKKPAVGDLTS